MSVKFTDENTHLEFHVLGYEFPEKGKKDDAYDANWLVVQIDYSDDQLTFSEKDTCLLSFELQDLTESIDDVLVGKETGLLMAFMEPYLTFAITQVGEVYAVQIRFVYDTSDGLWKDVYISQGMTLDELTNMNNGFKDLYKTYPYRETEK